MNRKKLKAYYHKEASQAELDELCQWLSDPANAAEATAWMRELFDETVASESELSRRKFREFCATVGLSPHQNTQGSHDALRSQDNRRPQPTQSSYDARRPQADRRSQTIHPSTSDRNTASPIRRSFGSKAQNAFTRHLPLIARIAAVLILPLIAGIVGFHLASVNRVEWREAYVDYGKTSELLLPDGTHLNLNAGTHVYYPSRFEGKERKIFVNGEVLAEVAKDQSKPFIVEAGELRVRVTGTKFNLRAYSDDRFAEIVLLEGSVLFDDATNKHYELRPGEAVTCDSRSKSSEKTRFKTELYRSFADGGSTCFLNRPFGEITSQLERLFDCKIVLLDEELADDRYFAYFTNNESLHDILHALNMNGEMSIRSAGNVIYIQAAEH
jgi:ferric-dicitrate binding protein FerR (iron transport regulator)